MPQPLGGVVKRASPSRRRRRRCRPSPACTRPPPPVRWLSKQLLTPALPTCSLCCQLVCCGLGSDWSRGRASCGRAGGREALHRSRSSRGAGSRRPPSANHFPLSSHTVCYSLLLHKPRRPKAPTELAQPGHEGDAKNKVTIHAYTKNAGACDAQPRYSTPQAPVAPGAQAPAEAEGPGRFVRGRHMLCRLNPPPTPAGGCATARLPRRLRPGWQLPSPCNPRWTRP